jgi:excinuclease ABC subunit C
MNDSFKFKLENIPHSSGIYKWLDKNNEILYIGKAKDLYSRVHQYFNEDASCKTKELINHAQNLDFIVTKNDNDALILENNLIIKHKPKYNILLKENNNYPYIVLTDEKDPRLVYTREYKKYKGTYFGPLAANVYKKYDIFKLLNEIFPLRKCQTVKKCKCLYYDMSNCLGPCINKVNEEKYQEIKKQIKQFFKGKKEVVSYLRDKEKKEANVLNFEKAKKYKDLIDSIKNIKDYSSITILDAINDVDIIGTYAEDNILSLIIHKYRKNILIECTKYIEEFYDSIEDSCSSILNQYYANNNNIPKKIYSSFPFISPIPLINDAKGKLKLVIENANENAKKYFKSDFLVYEKQKERTIGALKELSKVLNIPNLNLIHCFDISNFFSKNNVGAMIAIENGSFNKKLYRKFNINNKEFFSDSFYMAEVIERQYTRMVSNCETLPNLIIVDGGKIQINATIEALKKIELDKIIPVIGLSKDENHKTNFLVVNDENYVLDKKSNLFFFLFNIQEEVHRFAISFFRTKQKKEFV